MNAQPNGTTGQPENIMYLLILSGGEGTKITGYKNMTSPVQCPSYLTLPLG